MRRPLFFPIFILCLILSAAPGRAEEPLCTKDQAQDSETMFRVSTLPALMQGLYQGVLSIGELLEHGDLGLGTFHGLDGEMVVLDGKAWQVRVDGSVIPASSCMSTPYAAVTTFEPDATQVLLPAADLDNLKAQLTKMLPGPNLPCAVRVTGIFSEVTTRSVPQQSEPYPPLTVAAKQQAVFEAQGVAGTIVGFWLPETYANLGVAGFHLHFLSHGRDFGGHLLQAKGVGLKAEIDATPGLMVVLPQTEAFQNLDLTSHDQKAVDAVEKQ